MTCTPLPRIVATSAHPSVGVKNAVSVCELDAALPPYGIARDDVAYIMDTFPIVRRAKMKTLLANTAPNGLSWKSMMMAEAIHTGQSYQTRLDPPPADPCTAHAWDETYLGPYPRSIHLVARSGKSKR